jgi:hypothetical protein
MTADVGADEVEDERRGRDHESEELGKPRWTGILQLGRWPDPRPDEACVELRPHGPLEADERGESEHGDLGGEQTKREGASRLGGQQHDREDAGRGACTEPLQPRIDVAAKRAGADGTEHRGLRTVGPDRTDSG